MVRTKKNDQEPTVVKPWELTQADLDSITDDEVLKGTTRLLPSIEDIPEDFLESFTNVYIQMADALYCGDDIPQYDVQFNEGFDSDPTSLQRLITAHLRSFEPEYEHKIAGLAYMISIVVTITPEKL